MVDIDANTWIEADGIEDLASHHLGQTRFVRSRLGSPRRALLYRIDGRVKSEKLDGCEILGQDHQLVGFGLHPSGSAYAWRDVSPADTPATEVPLVTHASLDAFRAAAGAKIAAARSILPAVRRKSLSASPGTLATIAAGGAGALGWKAVDGLVVDGRESLLTWCVGKAGGDARRAWALFEQHADLSRPKGSDPSQWWSLNDAELKAEAWRRKAAQRGGGTRTAGRPRSAHRALLDADQRRAHTAAVDRAYRHGRIGPAAIVISAVMLDLSAGRLGMCTASVETIMRGAGRSRATVTKARAELIKAGLWAHEKAGVYAPVLSGEFFDAQPIENTSESSETVQAPIGPKGTVGRSQLCPVAPARASLKPWRNDLPPALTVALCRASPVLSTPPSSKTRSHERAE